MPIDRSRPLPAAPFLDKRNYFVYFVENVGI